MVWAPQAKTRVAVKFWVDCLQVLAIAVSVGAIAVTYYMYLGTRQAELKKPFNEKQLELYVEAARVVAHIAAVGPPIDKDSTTRFFEMYYGPLAFVESKGENSVAAVMIDFCKEAFGEDKCKRDTSFNKAGATRQQTLALKLSDTASAEIRETWTQGRNSGPVPIMAQTPHAVR